MFKGRLEMTKRRNESKEERKKRLLDQMRQKYNVPEETVEHADSHPDNIDPVDNKDSSEGIVAYHSERASPLSGEKATTMSPSHYGELERSVKELEKAFQKLQKQYEEVAQAREENKKLKIELKEIKKTLTVLTDDVENLKQHPIPQSDKSQKGVKVKLSQQEEKRREDDDQRVDQLYKELEALKEHLFELNKLKEYTISLKKANKMLEDKSRTREAQKHKKNRLWHRIFK